MDVDEVVAVVVVEEDEGSEMAYFGLKSVYSSVSRALRVILFVNF